MALFIINLSHRLKSGGGVTVHMSKTSVGGAVGGGGGAGAGLGLAAGGGGAGGFGLGTPSIHHFDQYYSTWGLAASSIHHPFIR